MKVVHAVVLALAAGVVCLAETVAQPPAGEDRAAAIKQALAANQAALRQYTWVETTQISLKGEEKKKEQKQCSYGADGKVQKTPLADSAPAAAPAKEKPDRGRRGGGKVKQAVVANKIEDMKEYVERVGALVHEYVPPDPARIQAAQAAGNVKVEPSQGVTALNIVNYLKPSDLLAIGFDAAAKKIKTFNVKSYVEKPKEDDVTLTVTFATLADGTSYPQHVALDIAAKKLAIEITNSGHRKIGT
ncbi:MAG TPA: hypothetical protein VKE51_29545 [Vicinamibacterales bacterium]|nr:hypothetical protein [Vicinamibacterales bacterium]